MSSRIRCFVVEPTDRVALKLRRFMFRDAPGAACPDVANLMRSHDFSVPIGEAPARLDANGNLGMFEAGEYAGDARWPARCSCGYEFQQADQWQVFQDRIYRRTDNGEEFANRALPAGAMYFSDWCEDFGVGDDGKALVVILPPGGGLNYWHVDGRANNNPSPRGWTRTGAPPDVTATPSILTPEYHGFLRNGWLEEC